MRQHVAAFLKAHTIEDIKKPVKGELHEYATDDASFWYGNGELIVSTDQDETVFVVDNVRGFDELIEY